MMTSASDWFPATVPHFSRRFSLALEEDGMLPAAALEKALESAAVQACAYARATVCSWLKWLGMEVS